MRYELSDFEWTAIKPMLPNKMRGVRRVNDRRVLNGIFVCCGRERPGATFQRAMGPTRPATIGSCAGARRKAGVWGQIMEALAAGHDAAVHRNRTSVVPVDQP